MPTIKVNAPANFRSAAKMPASNVIGGIKKYTEFTEYIEEGDFYKVSGYLHKSIADVITPIASGKTWPVITYHSQWDTDANLRPSDCGQTCCKMICDALGVSMSVNSFPYQSDQAGYTTPDHLVKNIHYAIPDLFCDYDAYDDVMDAPLQSIIGIDYGKIKRSSVQDKGFFGYHWVVLLQRLANGSCLVHDPDFWAPDRAKGSNKLYDAEDVANGFHWNGKCIAVYVKP